MAGIIIGALLTGAFHRGMKWLLRVALFALLLIAVLAAGAAWHWLRSPLSLAAPSVELSIEPGTNPARNRPRLGGAPACRRMRASSTSGSSGRVRRSQIRAGSYEVHAGITPRALLDKMVRGDQILEQLRLIEGWNWRQVRAALAAAPALKAKVGRNERRRDHGRVGPARRLPPRAASSPTPMPTAAASAT